MQFAIKYVIFESENLEAVDKKMHPNSIDDLNLNNSYQEKIK